MSAETQIPEDIMTAAQKAFDDAMARTGQEAGDLIIAKAILAERERCALIAEGDAERFARTKEFEKYGVRISDSEWVRLTISDAIRGEG